MKTYNNPVRSSWPVLCQRPVFNVAKLEATLAAIFESVRTEQDAALLAYTKRFDGVELKTIKVSQRQAAALASQVPKKLREAIDQAYQNIQTFHASQLGSENAQIETQPGVICWQEQRPIERVGLYIPGGSAPLFSTVLMLGVPAQLAGCQRVVLCSPPNTVGTLDPAIVYAAQLCDITKLFCVGGAQAIAAMAIGTPTIPKVDKLFGPGNQYVTGAKLYAQRYGVAIDMPAGPSEVLVVADESANPAFVAADLLSQAEHGKDSQVVLVTTVARLAAQVNQELGLQLKLLPRQNIAKEALKNSFCVIFDNLTEVLAFANTYAPEHMIVNITKPQAIVTKVQNAGSVFLGNYSPESAGDYASGTNHALPTNGWARSSGGVSTDSFTKDISFQQISAAGLRLLSPTITTMAEAEELHAHAQAVNIRMAISTNKERT